MRRDRGADMSAQGPTLEIDFAALGAGFSDPVLLRQKWAKPPVPAKGSSTGCGEASGATHRIGASFTVRSAALHAPCRTRAGSSPVGATATEPMHLQRRAPVLREPGATKPWTKP
jgi:hypothetical protein